MPNKEGSDYEVGYGKPPRHTRFKKGHSGNPNGRPNGGKNAATLLNEALHEEVVVNENGRRRKLTKLEAAMKQLANRAAAGDHRSLQLLLNQLLTIDRKSGDQPRTLVELLEAIGPVSDEEKE
jgi:hypothetical protein